MTTPQDKNARENVLYRALLDLVMVVGDEQNAMFEGERLNAAFLKASKVLQEQESFASDARDEGYPGIAHDFETMHSLLRAASGVLQRSLRHGLLHAESEEMVHLIDTALAEPRSATVALKPYQHPGEADLPPSVQECLRVELQSLGEIPDRNSPDDFPEGYVLTRHEIVTSILAVVAADRAARSSAGARMLGVVYACKECPNCRYNSGGTYQCDLTGAVFYNGKPHKIDSACPLPPVVPSATRDSKDAARWRGLKELAGYYQDGSQQTVKLYQDDALRSCFIEAGNKTYGTDGSSFDSAIDEAIRAASESRNASDPVDRKAP